MVGLGRVDVALGHDFCGRGVAGWSLVDAGQVATMARLTEQRSLQSLR